jgi:hypothetical protein
MDTHPTTSRDSGNCSALECAAVSRSLIRFTHDWRDEPMSDGGLPSYDRSNFEFPGTMVEISPSDSVVRHALTWRGMAAETVKATGAAAAPMRATFAKATTMMAGSIASAAAR